MESNEKVPQKNNTVRAVWQWIDKIASFCIRKILHIKLTDEQWNNYMQFVQFGIVGLSNTAISYITYLILIQFSIHYLVANMIGFFVSVINSFYWNNKYVFAAKSGEQRSILSSFMKTFLSYAGTGLVLANILLVLWVDILHINEVIAPAINLLITIPLNFLLNKLWAFRNKNKVRRG